MSTTCVPVTTRCNLNEVNYLTKTNEKGIGAQTEQILQLLSKLKPLQGYNYVTILAGTPMTTHDGGSQ